MTSSRSRHSIPPCGSIVRYATPDNFLSTPVYEEARAFLQRPAAEALVRAHRSLARTGHGLLVHDAYRPWWVTSYSGRRRPCTSGASSPTPAKGSRHNRGCAVDLTLYRLSDGRAVDMPGVCDEMTERPSPDHAGGPPEPRRLRDLLSAAMEHEGFTVYETEWWHFDYKGWRDYPILNVSFDAMRR